MAGKPRTQIDFDKIYESNSCGPFKIIKDLGRDEGSRLYVRVKFIETSTEKDVRYDLAMDGRVLDDLYGIDFNKIYQTLYYGPYQIIKFVGRTDRSRKIVRIRFLNTGYEYDVLLKQVRRGEVRDYSLGYHEKSYMDSNQTEYFYKIIDLLNERWKGMMSRCYNPNNIKYDDYGGSGVAVCERWQDFDNYITDMSYIPQYTKFYYDPANYQLDKDFLQLHIPKNQRIYSLQTCIFLSMADNANLSIKEKHNEPYYGVKEIKPGIYQVLFSVDGDRKIYGTYNNLNAALNDYNYYYQKYAKYELVPLFNEGIPVMSHEEAQTYLVISNR